MMAHCYLLRVDLYIGVRFGRESEAEEFRPRTNSHLVLERLLGNIPMKNGVPLSISSHEWYLIPVSS